MKENLRKEKVLIVPILQPNSADRDQYPKRSILYSPGDRIGRTVKSDSEPYPPLISIVDVS